MPRKKKDSNMTLVLESEGNAGTLEDIVGADGNKKEDNTLGASQARALASLTKKEKETAPTFGEEKKPQQIVKLDTKWCQDYLAAHNLVEQTTGSGQVWVTTLIDALTGNQVVGRDETGRPHTFGQTKERALVNAIEWHKRLPATEDFPPISGGTFHEEELPVARPSKKEEKEIRQKSLVENFGLGNLILSPVSTEPGYLNRSISKVEYDLLQALHAFVDERLAKVEYSTSDIKDTLTALLERIS
jgi:hypothetical protein